MVFTLLRLLENQNEMNFFDVIILDELQRFNESDVENLL